MPIEHNYTCDNCGRETGRELLTVKKVLFVEMGAGGKTLRSRVDSWLCPRCVKKDRHWNIESHRHPEERGPVNNSQASGGELWLTINSATETTPSVDLTTGASRVS